MTDHNRASYSEFGQRQPALRRRQPVCLELGKINFLLRNRLAYLDRSVHSSSFSALFDPVTLAVIRAIFDIDARTIAQIAWLTSRARNPPLTQLAVSTNPTRPGRRPAHCRNQVEGRAQSHRCCRGRPTIPRSGDELFSTPHTM